MFFQNANQRSFFFFPQVSWEGPCPAHIFFQHRRTQKATSLGLRPSAIRSCSELRFKPRGRSDNGMNIITGGKWSHIISQEHSSAQAYKTSLRNKKTRVISKHHD